MAREWGSLLLIVQLLLLLPSGARAATCNRGEFFTSATGSCAGCPVGKFRNTGDHQLETCVLCPAGKFTAVVGSTTCSFCPAGKYTPVAGREACEGDTCVSGRYGFLGMTSSVTAACVDCRSGQYISTTGATSCLGEPCPAGKAGAVGQIAAPTGDPCTNCEQGRYNNQQGQEFCQKCAKGRHGTPEDLQGGLRLSLASACLRCQPGMFAPAPGRPECSGTVCPAGRFGVEEAKTQAESACTLCAAGQYQSDKGQTICLGYECAAGKFGVLGSAEQLGPGGCVSCPGGQYQPLKGMGECVGEQCARGKYERQRNRVAEKLGACILCLPGRFTNETGLNACQGEVCPRGTFGTAGATSNATAVCERCLGGQFNDELGMSRCKNQPCQPGTFAQLGATLYSQADCTDCPPGKWMEHEGADQCNGVVCLAGRYAEPRAIVEKDAFCMLCRPGTYQGKAGQAQCIGALCAPGRFSMKGATRLNETTCITCPAGSYSDWDDTSTCKECRVRTTQGGTVTEFSIAGQSSCHAACPKDHGIFDEDVAAENAQRLREGLGAPLVMRRACSYCPTGKYYTSDAAGVNAIAGVCLRCSPERLCTGGHECATGYTGYLCMNCFEGFHMVDKNACEKCDTISAPTIAGACCAVMICWRLVLVLWRALQKAKRNRVNYFAWLTTLQKFSLIVSYMQVSQISVSLPLKWPSVVVRFWT